MEKSKLFDCNDKDKSENILTSLEKNQLKEKIFEDDVFYKVFKRKAASNMFYKVAISGLIFCSGWLFALGMPNKKNKDVLVSKNKTESEDLNLIDFDDERKRIKKDKQLKNKKKINRKRRNIKKPGVKNISKAKEIVKKRLEELDMLIKRVKQRLKLKKDYNKDLEEKEQKRSKDEKTNIKQAARSLVKNDHCNKIKNKNSGNKFREKNKNPKEVTLLVKAKKQPLRYDEKNISQKEKTKNKQQNVNRNYN